MPDDMKCALVIGASRSLGLGLVTALADRGWSVVGTVRGDGTPLHEIAQERADAVGVELVDITSDDELARLRDAHASGEFDLVFVNAGITDDDVPVSEIDADVFARVLVTNALAPLHAVETLAPLVADGGSIAVMSSRQGSISLNERGGHEVYRASKSALNQLMRSLAARVDPSVSLLLVHPGWVQTDLGGEGAPLTVEESARGVADMLERHLGEPGLAFRSWEDEVVPW